MTTPNPPAIGDENWGTELNDYLVNTLQAGLSQAGTAFGAHVSAAPATATPGDPHGDRAYAQQLMAPFSQSVNGPAGFVQLNASGQLPYGAWQDLRPVAPSFAATGSAAMYPPQLQITIGGRVELAGYIFVAGSAYNGQRVLVNALPSAARPLQPVSLPVTLSGAGTAASLQTPEITLAPDGSVTLNGCPAGLATGTAVGIYGSYPLDSYYGLIQG